MTRPSFLREPVTVPPREVISGYRALAARYRRIAARRGAKEAVIALAHTLLVIAYHVISRRQPYHELGEDDLQRTDSAARAKRLRLIQQLHGAL